jgi:hypothetical protein
MRSLPARVGLAEKAPRERFTAATVATSVAMLQTRYYAGCRQRRRCRHCEYAAIQIDEVFKSRIACCHCIAFEEVFHPTFQSRSVSMVT